MKKWLKYKIKVLKKMISGEYYFKNHLLKTKTLEEYQKNDLAGMYSILKKNSIRLKKASVLDIGCDVNEVFFLAKYVKKIVGIDIKLPANFQAKKQKGIEFLEMNAENLEFGNNTFDLVYSFNTFEHILDMNKCLSEQIRVLKPGGYGYAAWNPIWSGPKGHHIHEDMLEIWEKANNIEPQGYKNNSQFIPDWSHLLLNKVEMKNLVETKLNNQKIIDKLIHTIYHSKEFNRLFFDDFLELLKNKPLQIISLTKNKVPVPTDIQKQLQKKYNKNDFSTIGCQLLFKKLN